MTPKRMAVIGSIVVAALFAVIFFATALGYRSDCVRLEAAIKAQHETNKSNYDAMWKRFREMAQVTSMQTDDLERLYKGALTARYGEEGSRSAFQWIREHNPNLDSSVYVQLQRAIESGRTSFAADQQQLIDKKREYEVVLKSNRAVFVGWMFGFPTINLDQYGIVTSERTDGAFRRGSDDEVRLR